MRSIRAKNSIILSKCRFYLSAQITNEIISLNSAEKNDREIQQDEKGQVVQQKEPKEEKQSRDTRLSSSTELSDPSQKSTSGPLPRPSHSNSQKNNPKSHSLPSSSASPSRRISSPQKRAQASSFPKVMAHSSSSPQKVILTATSPQKIVFPHSSPVKVSVTTRDLAPAPSPMRGQSERFARSLEQLSAPSPSSPSKRTLVAGYLPSTPVRRHLLFSDQPSAPDDDAPNRDISCSTFDTIFPGASTPSPIVLSPTSDFSSQSNIPSRSTLSHDQSQPLKNLKSEKQGPANPNPNASKSLSSKLSESLKAVKSLDDPPSQTIILDPPQSEKRGIKRTLDDETPTPEATQDPVDAPKTSSSSNNINHVTTPPSETQARPKKKRRESKGAYVPENNTRLTDFFKAKK